MKLESLIEALLFSRAEPWDMTELAKALNESKENIAEGLSALEASFEGRGLCLVRGSDSVTLGTRPEAHAVLEKLYKDELEKTLSKPSVETLSIVMYGAGVTRGMIDYIRGVNSSFILRSLMVRGLVERVTDAQDKKRFIYLPTIELLTNLGVAGAKALPDYERINGELSKAMAGGAEKEVEQNVTQNEN